MLGTPWRTYRCRFNAWLSESFRDGDKSYPFTGGRYRIDPKLLSVDGIHIVARREGFEGRRKVSTI